MIEDDRVRIAATSDLHVTKNGKGYLPNGLIHELVESMSSSGCDLIVVGGDVTNLGTLDEAREAACAFRRSIVPVLAVPGNHDYWNNQIDDVKKVLSQEGNVTMLCDQAYEINRPSGRSIGIMGVEGGTDGGFVEYLTPREKQLIRELRGNPLASSLGKLRTSLKDARTKENIVVTHYSPSHTTAAGEERRGKLVGGSPRIGAVVDEWKDTVLTVIHGHLHEGTYSGRTEGGVPVYNVALQVLGRPKRVNGEMVRAEDLYRVITI